MQVGKGMRRANLAQGGLGKCQRVGDEGLEPPDRAHVKPEPSVGLR
jgi:hypothetical protein